VLREVSDELALAETGAVLDAPRDRTHAGAITVTDVVVAA
jgi:hypothetical protein